MNKLIRLFLLGALVLAPSCSSPVVPPDAGGAEKKLTCEKLSLDKTLGCKACAGYPNCGWKQTTSPVDGTCQFVDVNKPAPAGVTVDPTQCPAPPE